MASEHNLSLEHLKLTQIVNMRKQEINDIQREEEEFKEKIEDYIKKIDELRMAYDNQDTDEYEELMKLQRELSATHIKRSATYSRIAEVYTLYELSKAHVKIIDKKISLEC